MFLVHSIRTATCVLADNSPILDFCLPRIFYEAFFNLFNQVL